MPIIPCMHVFHLCDRNLFHGTRCDVVLAQRKTVMETWPELHKAVREALKSLSTIGIGTGSTTTMVAADLGCSSGPNTLLVVSEVMNTIGAHVVQEEPADNYGSRAVMEVQFFLNDLPGNDFNLVFRSLDQHQHQQRRLQGHGLMAAVEEKQAAVPCYIAGLPGSMYTRILPCQSVHLFHSSHCLIWRSKVYMHMHVSILLKARATCMLCFRLYF